MNKMSEPQRNCCLISKNNKAEKLKPVCCTIMSTTSHNGSDTTEVSIYCGWYFYSMLEVQYLIMAKENNLFCFIYSSYGSTITSRNIFPNWFISDKFLPHKHEDLGPNPQYKG